MRILGIDPALLSLGWGIIRVNSPKINYINSGVIKTTANMDIHLRLSSIVVSIEKLINSYQPEAIAMEETFVNLNAVSSLKLGYVRGAIMSIIGRAELPFYQYAANRIKKTVVGVGHADKQQIKRMIKMIVSGNSMGDISADEADALAVAYTCSVYNPSQIVDN